MKIERLIVKKTFPNEEIIRNIKFNLIGLSLIIDNTSLKSIDSGNNVGKTTALKIIDLCLGAKTAKSLYFDNDTKSENIEVKNFLNNNKVEAELIVIETGNPAKIHIVRQLYERGKCFIDGKPLKEREFWAELKKTFFDLTEEHPTYRNLMAKFIRIGDYSSDNMIKYLNQATTNDKYDTIYLFLFRILANNLLSKKDSLITDLKECEKKISFYKKDEQVTSLDTLRQRQELLETDILKLKEKRKTVDYLDEYKEELQKKRNLIVDINEIEQKIQLIEFDVHTILQSTENLKRQKSNIDIKTLKSLYREAASNVINMTKTFEEMVSFHNEMIQNRIKFIEKQCELKKNDLISLTKERNDLLEKSKEICIDMLDEGLLEELNALNLKIDELNIEKGKIEKSIEAISNAEKDINNFNIEINEIKKQMDPNAIQLKISIFNKFFSDYCERLYGEKYLFVYNTNWKKRVKGESAKFPVSIDQFKGNVGTGKKKAVIAAFDLAYISYVNKLAIKAPLFVIHDKLETTCINQLSTIFDICNNLDGQYIVPLLSERIKDIDNELIEKAKVLELSSDNKFFGID